MTQNATTEIFQKFIKSSGGVNKACRIIVDRLDNKWTWKYLYHVYRGTVKPSKKLLRQLKRLKPPKPKRKRYRKIIEANSKEQLGKWNMLNADELRNALDEKVKGKA